jgi:hypothetical protein
MPNPLHTVLRLAHTLAVAVVVKRRPLKLCPIAFKRQHEVLSSNLVHIAFLLSLLPMAMTCNPIAIAKVFATLPTPPPAPGYGNKLAQIDAKRL